MSADELPLVSGSLRLEPDRRGPPEGGHYPDVFTDSKAFALPLVLAIVFLAFHLPYLPASLEDLDSINFALGVRHFDVAQHQPHPPGYPLFIALVKVAHAAIPSEAAALSAVSVVAGALGALAVFALFRRFDANAMTLADAAHGANTAAVDDPPRPDAVWPLMATLLAVASPLYWFTAARPLSDTTGLVAAIAVQAMTLAATTGRALIAASFCAALAAGLRSQVVWLTVPLLAMCLAQQWRAVRPVIWKVLAAYTAGILTWAVPLVLLNGGPRAYWRALFSQGAEDLTGIQMLWTTPTPRVFASALYYAFVAPWAIWPVAAIVLLLAAAGGVMLLGRARAAALVLAASFGPYLVFDVVFQETFTTRYALPLAIPVAYLAVRGARLLPRTAAIVVVVCIAMGCAHIGGTSVAAYAKEKAPAFRLLDDMREAARGAPVPPVLAMDRREAFDLRRPIRWVGDQMPAIERTLPSPPQHEWLELVKYWNGGGRSPVWFLADPLRTDIDLIGHREPVRYRWSVPYPVLLGGVRPNEIDFYRIERPVWYAGEGWALTPEAAGVAEAEGKGLAHGPIDLWVDNHNDSHVTGSPIVVGGRNFSSEPARVAIKVADWLHLADFSVPPGAFLRIIRTPNMEPIPPGDYLKLTVISTPGARVAMEQFDAKNPFERPWRPVIGFGDGWHESEYNPRTGLRWRWLSERGEIRYAGAGGAIVLHLEGESPLTYFSRPSQLTVKVGDRAVRQLTLVSDFTLDMRIRREELPGVEGAITLETDQTYVPAERSRRTGDRRHLGLRIFKCELRAAP